MSFRKSFEHGALAAIALLHPPYPDFIRRLDEHEDQLMRVGPILDAAVRDGGSAFDAAREASPTLAHAIEDFVDPGTAADRAEERAAADKPQKEAVEGDEPVQEVVHHHAAIPPAKHVQLENVTRLTIGHKVMTDEEAKAWMDRQTPHNDPAQENSNVGSG